MKELEKILVETFSASTGIILFNFRGGEDIFVDEKARQALSELSIRAGGMLKSVFELHGSLEDLVLARRMLNRYPWHRTEISKVKHFELTWFLFENLCYKFKEKLKLCFNSQKMLCNFIGEQPPSWLKAELRVVDQAFGPAIKARGNTVHSWDERQPAIDWLGTVSFLKTAKDQGEDVELPQGFFDLDGHYRDAKRELRSDTKAMEDAGIALMGRILQFHMPTPKKLLEKSQSYFDAVGSVEQR